MGERLNVGLVGYGMAGRVFHAPLIEAAAGLHLYAVVERHAEQSRQRYPWVKIVRSVAALAADTAVDLIVIATPNSSHFELARQALQAGKHVVVDKPFTNNTAEADALINLAAAQQRTLSVFHNRRWDGDFLTVQRLLKRGLLGQLAVYEAAFDRFRPQLKPNAWREAALPGSGLLFDLGSHLLDQVVQLFGWPQTIAADVRIERPGMGADDAFTVRLGYAQLQATVRAGMLMRLPRPRFRLAGAAGSFVKHGLDPQEAALANGRSPLEPGWGAEPRQDWGTLDTEIDGLHVVGQVETVPGRHLDFYENVAAAVRGEAALAVTAVSARHVIRLIELAQESSKTGRTLSCH